MEKTDRASECIALFRMLNRNVHDSDSWLNFNYLRYELIAPNDNAHRQIYQITFRDTVVIALKLFVK